MANNIQYDPTIIQHFADALYAQARSIIVTATIFGAVTGFVAGILAAAAMRADGTAVHVVVASLIGGTIGFFVGRARAFSLKLQAQTALCQMNIEKNTRA